MIMSVSGLRLLSAASGEWKERAFEMKTSVFAFAVLSAFAVSCTYAAAPQVTVTGLSRDAATRRVTVKYRLYDAPAVITVSFLTNGAPVAAEDCAFVIGDVNRRIDRLEEDLTIGWTPKVGVLGKSSKLSACISAWPVDAPPDYMDICLSISNCVRYYARKESVPGGVTNRIYKSERLLLRKIPARNVVWTMGTPDGEVGRNGESPYYEIQHKVKLTEDYYMAVFPTTQRQSMLLGRTDNGGGSVLAANSSDYRKDGYEDNWMFMPQDRISLNALRGDHSNWAGWPSLGHEVKASSLIGQARKHTGVMLDLPTEAQWEYACRAGTSTAFNNGKNAASTTDFAAITNEAWIARNSVGCSPYGVVTNQPREVGLKLPNAWGLYDMHGNMYDWCLDRVANKVYRYNEPEKVYVDPVGTNDTAVKTFVIRGGDYSRTGVSQLRSGYCTSTGPAYNGYVGYRLCCPAVAVR